MAKKAPVSDRRRNTLLRRFYDFLLPGITAYDSRNLRKQIYRVQTVAFFGVIFFVWSMNLLPDILYNGKLDKFSWADWMELIFMTIWMLLLLAFTLAITHLFLKRMRYLEGFLPVCSFCKSIRVDGQWESLEHFVRERSNVTLTHSLCPSCARQHYEYEEEAAARDDQAGTA